MYVCMYVLHDNSKEDSLDSKQSSIA